MATIMIVEGDLRVAKLISRSLRALGHRTSIAPNSEMASAIVFTVKPDVIALDIDSPIYCGLDFHELLKGTPRGKAIPVVYLSETCNWVQREWAELHGAKGIIYKNDTPDQVALAIHEFLQPDQQAGAEVLLSF